MAEQHLVNVDFCILRHVLSAALDQAIGESDLVSTRFSDARAFLTGTRVRFLSALRFSLRGSSEGYRLVGHNNSLSEIDIMKKGIENPEPSLWEDIAFCAPFNQNVSTASMA